MKDKLIIPSNLIMSMSPWTKRTIYKLVESKMFDVREEVFPEIDLKPIVGKRHNFIGFFKFNDILMAVDVWDGPQPTILLADWFKSDPFYSKTKIIFKIQYCSSVRIKEIDQFVKDSGIHVTNWTMFHSDTFPLEYFKWDKNKNHKYLTYVSGKRRQDWLDYYENSKEVATYSNSGLKTVPKGRAKLMVPDFLEIMKDCKWGLSLKGKRIGNMDCKNRREVEFASAGMPLALNYKPEYPFPFEAGKHYVYVEKPENLMILKDIDPIPYAEASLETYNKYFSAKGSSEVFLELVSRFRL